MPRTRTTSKAIKILLVDDHTLVRSAIRQLLQSNSSLQVVAEADTGESAIDLCKKHRPDLVMLDIELPDLSGIEVAKRLVHLGLPLKILAISGNFDETYLSRLIKLGVSGYLPKSAKPQEFSAAIKSILNGQTFISQAIAEKVTQAYLNQQHSPFDGLSQRELEILIMLCQGVKTADIAKKLFISPKTVNAHRKQLFLKLDVSNNIELAKLAIQHGLIKP